MGCCNKLSDWLVLSLPYIQVGRHSDVPYWFVLGHYGTVVLLHLRSIFVSLVLLEPWLRKQRNLLYFT